ncbi:hypothetical protein EVJ58_g10699 [Rhodofomes roseus]|uniref:DUF6534 domain-containing protein n=1 Tax=Rhodofomes roseus TaxID=34475 RepID=A0A4Y9XP78_9APHY|nr:hypothetical protein EVJ58_g10699 [Rhodofomes roseus]
MALIGLTAGAVEVGILISTFLYGITTVQAYVYSRSNHQDPLWLKSLVGIVWLLETLLTVLTCMYLYSLTITNFGNLDTLQNLPWPMDVSFAVGGLISALVQSFFAWRVHVISRRLETSIVSWIACLCRVAITLTICILDIKSKTVGYYESQYGWTITFSLSLAVFIDVLNTCSLCFWLWRQRNNEPAYEPNSLFASCPQSLTSPLRTRALIDSVMKWTIETGLVTSICEILMVSLNLTQPQDDIWISILMFYARLYSNSLLLSLNARDSLRKRGPAAPNISTMNFNAQPISISVTQDVESSLEMDTLGDSRPSKRSSLWGAH